MSYSDLANRYELINKSFAIRYLFWFGQGKGFCAEYVGLIKTTAYCLENRYQLCLQKMPPEGFLTQAGWRDYFSLDLQEDRLYLLGRLNTQRPRRGMYQSVRKIMAIAMKFFSKSSKFKVDTPANPSASLLTPGLELGTTWQQKMQSIARLLWIKNEHTAKEVTAKKSELPVSTFDIGVHLRRGDKITETSYISENSYLLAICRVAEKSRNNTTTVYLASDDVDAAHSLASRLPSNFKITISPGARTGHDQKKFNSQKAEIRRENMIALFVDLEVLAESTYFLGTETSNIFHCVVYLRGDQRCTSVS